MPHIRMHEVKVRGPLFETWPPPSQQIVFGNGGKFQEEKTREILQRFAEKAYRRPTAKAEIDRLMGVVAARKKNGQSPRDAVKDAVKAALCSPAFLYLLESSVKKEDKPKLGAHDLASRLSYFLWSTMPDDTLRQTADSGKLLHSDVLMKQLDRMLKDSRSDEFISGFLDSWLNLRSLGDMPPDRDTFRVYYAKDLQTAMKMETQTFTRNLIDNNAPITDYIDSDYTFVNKPLAKLYQLPGKFAPEKAHQFQKVSLQEKRRGGLLGMGSVLTVTANGIETSPVVRGVWLLENILGTPPPPPPDDVPPIDPDIRGATSIRDQLTKHREQATCYDCHMKIDPPGFALENFDPIGRWRTRYPAGKKEGPKIDPSGELPNGDSFENIVEFKKLIMKRKDLFARMLTERMLSYATGRRMEVLDRPEVDRIVGDLSKEGYGMRTLIKRVVASEIFRSR